jgi:kynureninase
MHRLAGWWGGDKTTKFEMSLTFQPSIGASRYRLSNPCVISVMALTASLGVFAQTSMTALRDRSVLLTGYLEHLLGKSKVYRIITPPDPKDRGCQLSIQFPGGEGVMMRVFEEMYAQGVIVDERKPDVIRISPAPIYNTFGEVEVAARAFLKAAGGLDL